MSLGKNKKKKPRGKKGGPRREIQAEQGRGNAQEVGRIQEKKVVKRKGGTHSSRKR